jgi:pilus assembly protein CpaE
VTALVEQDAALVDLWNESLGGAVTALGAIGELDRHLAAHPHEQAVVLVRHDVDTAVLTAALGAGVRAVVDASDVDGLVGAVARARDLAQRSAGVAPAPVTPGPAEAGLVVTLFSVKGGVGKSLVATNLAAALADEGRTVCLVDLDVTCGDVAILLGLTPAHTLADLARLDGEIDPSGVRSLLTKHSERLSVLAAPIHLGERVPVEPIGDVLGTLAEMFDVVVVDTGGTPDIPSLKSLKLATGTLDLLDLPRERWRLVLNRTDSRAGLAASEFESTLGLPVLVDVPAHRAVLSCVNRAETIVRSHPGHAVAKALRSLAAATGAEADARRGSAAPVTSHRIAPRRLRRTKKVG